MTIASDRPKNLPQEAPQEVPQEAPRSVTFDAFIDWYPETSEIRYELHRGVIVPMPKPRGEHSDLAGFIHDELAIEIRRLNLPYFIPREAVIKCNDDTGYEPDVIVLDRTALENEPRWKSSSIIENAASIKLVVEVVSSNWQDDYERKMADYETLQIPEYWIVDYAALGGIRHLGRPKQPTLTIATLIDGEYEIVKLREGDRITSPTFPELNLTAEQILTGGLS